jgi:two-component system, response regulator, stage 0 sporulation protein F
MKGKILVVDDEQHILLLCQKELEEEGYEVATKDSGEDLLEEIDQQHPDAVILDVRMPGYDGLDLLQGIRQKFYDLPVILFSAYDSHQGSLKAAAADYYVIKSSSLEGLKARLVRALEAGKQQLQ